MREVLFSRVIKWKGKSSNSTSCNSAAAEAGTTLSQTTGTASTSCLSAPLSNILTNSSSNNSTLCNSATVEAYTQYCLKQLVPLLPLLYQYYCPFNYSHQFYHHQATALHAAVVQLKLVHQFLPILPLGLHQCQHQ